METSRAKWMALIAVLTVSGLLSMVGANHRSLSLGEGGVLTGAPLDILVDSLDPETGAGVLPLSYWIRWVFLGALDLGGISAWRMHAILGHVGAAALTWWVFARRGSWNSGLWAGLLVAAHPLLVFHGHESSCFAWSALTGVLTIAGVIDLYEGRAGGSGVLASGLVLGALNDVFFAFSAVAAVFACVWVVARSWDWRASAKRVFEGWLRMGLVIMPPAAVYMWRISKTRPEDLFSIHLQSTLVTNDSSLFFMLGQQLSRFGAGMVSGHVLEPTSFNILGMGGMLFVVVSSLAAMTRQRNPIARLAGGFVLSALAAQLLAAVVFREVTGQVFPDSPHVSVALVPAVAIALVGGFHAAGERIGRVMGASMASLLVLFSVVQLGAFLNDHHWPEQTIGEKAEESDVVVTDRGLHPIVSLSVPGLEVTDCLSGRPPDRLWSVVPMERGGDTQYVGMKRELPGCDGQTVPLPGHVVVSVYEWVPAAFETRGDPTMGPLSIELLVRPEIGAGAGDAASDESREVVSLSHPNVLPKWTHFIVGAVLLLLVGGALKVVGIGLRTKTAARNKEEDDRAS